MRKAVCVLLALALIVGLLVAVGVDTAEAADSNYTVQRGDTLTGIAARYGLTVSALAA